jgi:hypothetical protein
MSREELAEIIYRAQPRMERGWPGTGNPIEWQHLRPDCRARRLALKQADAVIGVFENIEREHAMMRESLTTISGQSADQLLALHARQALPNT